MILADVLVLVSRFMEYSGAMILFGSSLFLLYGRPIASDAKASDLIWTKHLLIGAAIGIVVATAAGFIAQTATLAGSFGAVSDPANLKAALLGMNFGISSLVRLATALLALTSTIFWVPGTRLWSICAALGTIASASFAWMGHGAATEGSAGWVHLVGDIAHLLATAGWIGALAAFWIILARPISSTGQQALCHALVGFSGVGTALVGSPQTVATRLREYQALGIRTVIASGYPHLEEAYRVAELLFPELGIGNQAYEPGRDGGDRRLLAGGDMH